MNPDRIDVAAGVIMSVNRGSVLLAKRSARQHQGNLWEFPGGKLEANECAEHALVRELQEELGINATHAEPLITIEHDYPDKSVVLHVFIVKDFTGLPTGREGQPLKWVAVEALSEYEFPEANVPIVEALLATQARFVERKA